LRNCRYTSNRRAGGKQSTKPKPCRPPRKEERFAPVGPVQDGEADPGEPDEPGFRCSLVRQSGGGAGQGLGRAYDRGTRPASRRRGATRRATGVARGRTCRVGLHPLPTEEPREARLATGRRRHQDRHHRHGKQLTHDHHFSKRPSASCYQQGNSTPRSVMCNFHAVVFRKRGN
jgi:hypothetical protein